jgi:hypothetical protein
MRVNGGTRVRRRDQWTGPCNDMAARFGRDAARARSSRAAGRGRRVTTAGVSNG